MRIISSFFATIAVLILSGCYEFREDLIAGGSNGAVSFFETKLFQSLDLSKERFFEITEVKEDEYASYDNVLEVDDQMVLIFEKDEEYSEHYTVSTISVTENDLLMCFPLFDKDAHEKIEFPTDVSFEISESGSSQPGSNRALVDGDLENLLLVAKIIARSGNRMCTAVPIRPSEFNRRKM